MKVPFTSVHKSHRNFEIVDNEKKNEINTQNKVSRWGKEIFYWNHVVDELENKFMWSFFCEINLNGFAVCSFSIDLRRFH